MEHFVLIGRMKMKKVAEDTFRDIKEMIGSEKVEMICNEAFKESSQCKDQILKIMKLFEKKEDKKVDKSKDFRAFLKN